MHVLGLIPARGGSKGVPRKNARLLGGKPLIAYTIEAARASSAIDRVVVSTDDEEIREVSKSLGAEAPFLRPATLAGDTTPMLPVILHALEALAAEGWRPDLVCLLQPTFPFRRAVEIERCIETLQSEQADCVFTVHRVPHQFNPHWVYLEREDGSLRLSTGESEPIARRQALPPAVHRSGSVYVSRASNLTEHGTLYGDRIFGVETPVESSCNIDTLDDWAQAEALVEERGSHVVD